jgi:hypothetical protein
MKIIFGGTRTHICECYVSGRVLPKPECMKTIFNRDFEEELMIAL